VKAKPTLFPVAWTILKSNHTPGKENGWACFGRSNLPSEMVVIVLTDRGLYASWLFREILRLKWHPFMRINAGGTFHAEGSGYYRPLVNFAPQPNTRFSACGTAFKTKGKQLPCTLLACWEQQTKLGSLSLTFHLPVVMPAGTVCELG